MSIDDVTLEEGDEGTTNASFEVTLLDSLGDPANEEITVNYATVADTATANDDFTATSGTLTFNVGDSIKRITVPIDFNIVLDEAATETITVNYATVGDTAIVGEDFVSTEGILTFAPGDTEKSISVLVNGDTNIEEDERFFFELSNPTGNATLSNERATGTINNDDINTPVLNRTINRFQNKDVAGTYLFAGESESANIRENFPNFEEEGTAFTVAGESGDGLIPLVRFQSTRNPGTYLLAGEQESENIRENFANDFNEEGLAFYVYGVGTGLGTEFTRFQNSDKPGTYLFAGPDEAQGIRENFPSFLEEGPAFEVGV